MKVSHNYKYLKLKNKDNLFMECNFDNTIGKGTYGVTLNIRLMDDDVLGRVCGIGDTEIEAIDACLLEFNNYLKNDSEDNYNNSKLSNMSELSRQDFETCEDLPLSIAVETSKGLIFFYYKVVEDKIIILTNEKKFELDYIEDYKRLLKNICKLVEENQEDFTDKYLKENEFYPTFESIMF